MSYDLIFEGGGKLNKKAFAAYFHDRAHYEVGNGQAVYQNEDTGVYFIFDEPEDGAVAFNLNYFRPHVFGLEAAPEIAQFAEAFGAAVIDPQGEIGEGEAFSREAFLMGWNAGNRLAYRSMLKEQAETIYTWPAKKIRDVWEWNYTRGQRQEQAGENVFIPAIFAIAAGGEALGVAIWPPDCAILLPPVDGVLVPVAQSGKESEEVALTSWNEVQPIVQAYQVEDAGLTGYRLAFEAWPEEVAAFLGRSRPAAGELQGVGFDYVLDQELVQEATGG